MEASWVNTLSTRFWKPRGSTLYRQDYGETYDVALIHLDQEQTGVPFAKIIHDPYLIAGQRLHIRLAGYPVFSKFQKTQVETKDKSKQEIKVYLSTVYPANAVKAELETRVNASVFTQPISALPNNLRGLGSFSGGPIYIIDPTSTCDGCLLATVRMPFCIDNSLTNVNCILGNRAGDSAMCMYYDEVVRQFGYGAHFDATNTFIEFEKN